MAKNLEEVLIEIQSEEEVEHQSYFLVNNLETAAEAQRRISYFNEQNMSIDNIIQKQIEPFLKKIEKIKEWGEEAKKEHNEKINYYSMLLENYIREEIEQQTAAGKKPKKTIKLPYGKISLKSQQPEFQKDEKVLYEFAKQNGYVVPVEPKLDWSTLKKSCTVLGDKLVTEDGEVVPGIVVFEREDKFYLELEV